MTEHPGEHLFGSSDPREHRTAIVLIENTIATVMPGKISLLSLQEFGEKIIAAIDSIRTTEGFFQDKQEVLLHLYRSTIVLQNAIDEFQPRGNRNKRYQNIHSVRQELESALNAW